MRCISVHREGGEGRTRESLRYPPSGGISSISADVAGGMWAGASKWGCRWSQSKSPPVPSTCILAAAAPGCGINESYKEETKEELRGAALVEGASSREDSDAA